MIKKVPVLRLGGKGVLGRRNRKILQSHMQERGHRLLPLFNIKYIVLLCQEKNNTNN